jgi:hypothetical protein
MLHAKFSAPAITTLLACRRPVVEKAVKVPSEVRCFLMFFVVYGRERILTITRALLIVFDRPRFERWSITTATEEFCGFFKHAGAKNNMPMQ